ncbi:nicotinamide riboside transporter PnuC [Mucilaginibacter galii]|uniref:Nicotinamide riboside transporter PnuC n=1 Tax=Mucilaginibacter galii TaxID=2005073 RepID=A0A917N0X2_9SPHI|nr:nicotinamide riboside transporter PnuC [Mucilaginibacter galii]GGI49894.1 nicotinamide mononucleotide transporter [Mucilaginibacter galii]
MQAFHAITQWLQSQSPLELTGVVTGLLCVYLAAINNIWNWPFAIISTGIYIFIFAQEALYADALQNIYLFAINIYGWYYWSRQPANAPKVPVVRITHKQVVFLLLIAALATPVLGFTLVSLTKVLHYQPAAYPYLDSFCTVVSLTAQVFMARKVLENWLIWIFVDVIYVGIYLAKGLEPTAIMFGIYAVLALVGYIDWRKDYRKQLI